MSKQSRHWTVDYSRVKVVPVNCSAVAGSQRSGLSTLIFPLFQEIKRLEETLSFTFLKSVLQCFFNVTKIGPVHVPHNAWSLTHWARPGIEPASSRIPRWVRNPLTHDGNCPLLFLNMPVTWLPFLHFPLHLYSWKLDWTFFCLIFSLLDEFSMTVLIVNLICLHSNVAFRLAVKKKPGAFQKAA